MLTFGCMPMHVMLGMFRSTMLVVGESWACQSWLPQQGVLLCQECWEGEMRALPTKECVGPTLSVCLL